MRTARPTPAELTEWLGAWMQTELRVDREQMSPERSFVSYGMDSIHSMMLVGDLEEYLNCRLSPTLAWDHPTPAALAAHLAEAPRQTAESPHGGGPGDLLDRIDDLPEEVIDRLLRSRLEDAERT